MSLQHSTPPPGADPTGVVVVDKPCGLTSSDVVVAARRRLGTRAIGHCGTLDPLASGVLVLVVGRARRVQDLLMRRDKAYDALVVLGATSHTLDAEGPVTSVPDAIAPTRAEVEQALREQSGEILQRPPAHSAVHVAGERAWRATRRGEVVELPLRRVQVHELALLDYAYPELRLSVRCGKGTYVRSIARDLGEALGCGAYLGGLRRTMACGISLEHAVALEELSVEGLVGLRTALADEPRIELGAEHHQALRQGALVPVEVEGEVAEGEPLFAWIEGEPIAWVRKVPGGLRSRALLESTAEGS